MKALRRESAATVKSMAKDALGSSAHNLGKIAQGSRFSQLQDLAEVEVNNVEDANMDKSEGQGMKSAPWASMARKKRKSAMREEEVVLMEEVDIKVLNPSLIGVAKTLFGSGVNTNGKKKKDCVMKDVANVLEARPIKLKLA